MTKFGLEVLIGKAFNCLFDLNLSMKRVKKVFVYIVLFLQNGEHIERLPDISLFQALR